jgi:3(or 17)beta-hydroxysteroid dehydrogenase
MSLRLENKVALVTGGGSGLGEATCKRFAQEGAVVIVSDIDEDNAKRVATEICESGGEGFSKYQDVVDEKRWEEVVSEIIAEYGKLDVLVNNAGIAIIDTVESTSLEVWKRTQAVNGESVFLGTRAAIKVMKKNGGSIINIASIEGLVGEPKAAAYNFSKGGVTIFTKSAAIHCATEGYAVRINSVHPGYFMTPMFENAVGLMSQDEANAFSERVVGNIPMGRMGNPVDIANGCLFLASDESTYMTGSQLVIDGGYTAH